MNAVIDTSAIIAVIANEPEREALIEITRGVDLIAPHSVHWEIGNAFSAMLKRERITLPAAIKAIEAYNKIKIRFVDIDIEKTLRIAHRLSVYAYDAYIISCALHYKYPIVSLDKSLIQCAKKMKVEALEVVV
jgi:predicted nucleic acid-binding protein